MKRIMALLMLLAAAVMLQGQTILIVDDDMALGVGPEFPGSLNRVGYSGYQLWSVADSSAKPDSLRLSDFDVVIWNQADYSHSGAITAGDTLNIGAYLNHGGKLWLVGNNYVAKMMYDYGWTMPLNWLPVVNSDYPAGTYLDTLVGVPGDAITNGLRLPINRSLTVNTEFSDTINTLTAEICFQHNGAGSSALHHDGYANGGKLFFMAAPYEGIATNALKDTLTKRAMIWFGYEVRFKDIAATGITYPAALVSAADSITIVGQFRSLSLDSLLAVPVVATVTNGGSIVFSDTVTMDTIAPNQTKSVTYKKLYWPVFDTLQLTCKAAYSQDMWPANDTISKQFITVPGLVYSDDFEYGFDYWIGDWALTTEQAQSGTHSLTDWPYHDYPINSDRFVCLDTVFNLTGFSSASLLFNNAHWIETGYDFGYVMVSQDSGAHWDSVASFTGIDSVWHSEIVDLNSYTTSNGFMFGFRMGSDALLNMKGWFIDDIILSGTTIKQLGIEGSAARSVRVDALSQIAPNPSSGQTTVSFQVGRDNSRVSLKVYNLAGQLVRTVHEGAMNSGSHSLRLDGANLSTGVYFVRLKVNDFAATKRLTVLR